MTNRRNFIKQISAAVLLGHFNGAAAPFATKKDYIIKKDITFNKARIRGPLPIMSTPFLENGGVDYEVLAKEAQFIRKSGCPGMIWPQSEDSCDLLSREEKYKGMEAIVNELIGTGTLAVFGCQGKNIEDMLKYADFIQKLAEKSNLKIAVISRPPDDGKTETDLVDYYEELAKHMNHPIIIQTGGGINYKGVMPSVKLLIELAKKYPDKYGFIKEESGNCNQRIIEEINMKPIIKTVFSAWGSYQWLYQGRHLGTEGLITERPAYADIIAYIWEQMENGDKNNTLNDAFAHYLLMLNLSTSISDSATGNDLRGPHLYILKNRGIFRNCLSRVYEWKDNKRIIPKSIIIKDLELTEAQKEEIESRFLSLKPYLRSNLS